MRARTGRFTVAEQVLTESLSAITLSFEPKVTNRQQTLLR